MTRQEMAQVMERVFAECRRLRDAGQREYAHREDNAFGNFERVAERPLARGRAAGLYGIHAYVQGHRSQREDVRGRINDAIVYLTLLRGMIDEREAAP